MKECADDTKPLLPNDSKSRDNAGSSNKWKYISIILLTIQQTSMPLMAGLARDREVSNTFITTVNVFFMDIIKLIVCSAILIADERSVIRFLKNCHAAVFGNLLETAKICIPSLIYNFQNNLYYIALSNLESTTFCVLYQMKILTTALMMRVVLKRKLSTMQWVALLLLIPGVIGVQTQYEPPKSRGSNKNHQNASVGFIAVLTMCVTSAFAGVYMEKILKKSQVDVFIQNIRLALFGLLISIFSMWFKDYDSIRKYGFLVGFDTLVWILTVTNSAGGLFIAVVMKYADNISKTYAQSMAIIGAAVGSWILFDYIPNAIFVFGTTLVIFSIYIYSVFPNKA